MKIHGTTDHNPDFGGVRKVYGNSVNPSFGYVIKAAQAAIED